MKTVEGDGTVRYNIYDATADSRTDYIAGPNGTLARMTQAFDCQSNGKEPNSLAVRRSTAFDPLDQMRAFRVHADHLGTARSGTGWGGAELWEDFHTPYGESLIHPDETDDQGDYTGHIRDKSTGLTYMQARYYDPVIGRFLSEDPVGMLDNQNPSFFNRYRYCANNPISCTDPTGMYDEEKDEPQNQEVNAHPLPDSVPQKEQIAGGSTTRFGGSVQSQAPTNKTGVYEVKSTSVGEPISVGKIVPFVGKKIPKAGAGNAVNITVTTSTAGNRNTKTTQDVPLATGEATSTFIELPSNAGTYTSITVQGMSPAPVYVDIYSVNSYDEEVYDALGPTN